MFGLKMFQPMIQLDWKAWIRESFEIIQCWHMKLIHIPSPGTSHIVAIDHTGLAISEITTINTLFGSRVMVPETGIIMNNEMDGKSSKQPLSQDQND